MNQTYIQRSVFEAVWLEVPSDKVIFLTGARQVGKTTILRHLMERLNTERAVPPSHLHFVDLENTQDLAVWDDQATALATLPKSAEQTHYYFIDEFQNARTIGVTLKVIHDHHPHIKLIVTGSASWYLDINESLAGRKRVFTIWPFSFAEYLHAVAPEQVRSLYRLQDVPPAAPDILNSHLTEFLTFGGYPEVVLTQERERKAELLEGLMSAYLLKDVRLWQYSANTLEVQKLLALLSSQVGSLLSQSDLARNTGLGATALKNRLELLQTTFILHTLPPYHTNPQKELVKAPKAFVVDTGLRNSLLGTFSITPHTPLFGILAENFVVTELLKKRSVFEKLSFWRTKDGKEVDVVLQRNNALIPIEVKSGNAEHISTGLRAFIRTYTPKEAYMLNWSIVQDVMYEGCNVHFRPIWFAGRL